MARFVNRVVPCFITSLTVSVTQRVVVTAENTKHKRDNTFGPKHRLELETKARSRPWSMLPGSRSWSFLI